MISLLLHLWQRSETQQNTDESYSKSQSVSSESRYAYIRLVSNCSYYAIMNVCRKYQQRLPYDLLSALANSLLDGTVFDIVQSLKEVQYLEEKALSTQRLRLVNEHRGMISWYTGIWWDYWKKKKSSLVWSVVRFAILWNWSWPVRSGTTIRSGDRCWYGDDCLIVYFLLHVFSLHKWASVGSEQVCNRQLILKVIHFEQPSITLHLFLIYNLAVRSW